MKVSLSSLLTNKKLRFALIGGINTAIDFSVFVLLTSHGLNTIVANTSSTSLGMVSSFFMNRKFTFGPSGAKRHHEIMKFLAVTLIGLWVLQPIVIYGVAFLGTSIGHFTNDQLVRSFGKLVSIGVSLVWNYYWYNNYVFKKPTPSA